MQIPYVVHCCWPYLAYFCKSTILQLHHRYSDTNIGAINCQLIKINTVEYLCNFYVFPLRNRELESRLRKMRAVSRNLGGFKRLLIAGFCEHNCLLNIYKSRHSIANLFLDGNQMQRQRSILNGHNIATLLFAAQTVKRSSC